MDDVMKQLCFDFCECCGSYKNVDFVPSPVDELTDYTLCEDCAEEYLKQLYPWVE